MIKIRLCEDEPDLRHRWTRTIQDAIGSDDRWSVESIEDPGDDIRLLLSRQSCHHSGSAAPAELGLFDETDVLVVDYDLTLIDAENARHTGEELARLSRLYSRVGYIIVTNQGSQNFDFDLSLKGRPGSYGDLNIPAETLRFPSLWSVSTENSFKPWAWDDIPESLDSRHRLTEEIATRDNIKASILDFLKIPSEAVQAFDDAVYEFLLPAAEDEKALREQCTFETFLTATTERKALDRLLEADHHQACAVAVARLAKGFSRLLLGPQDVLVDVPHLLQRYPFLMSKDYGDPADPEAWGNACRAGLRAVDSQITRDCAFEQSELWLGKPTLWWPLVERHPKVSEARQGFDPSSAADVVFAEDCSAFIPFDAAKEFRAGFHNRFDSRFIAYLEGVRYGPSRRLAFV